jgi:uncharacterized protein (UPF0264 family)
VIKRIREITPLNLEVSCTLGDLPNLPGSVALAALGAASTGVNYIKVSLLNIKTQEEAIYLLKCVAKAAREYNSSIKIAVSGFGDADRVGSVNPLMVPLIGYVAEVDVVMLDTGIKDGKNLFDFLKIDQLKAFVNEAHGYGLKSALAGSLRKENLPILCEIGVDIVGVRGAACNNGDRVKGRITREKVQELAQIIRNEEKKVSAGF